MKREGWQHDPQKLRRPSLHLTEHSIAVAGGSLSAKAPSRPGGGSKLSGKNLDGHSLPVSKSRDKAKGAHKLRSCNVVLNHKLVSWRVVDEGPWPEFAGASATDLLSQLSGMWWNDVDNHEDEVEEHGDQSPYCFGIGGGGCCDGEEGREDIKEDDVRHDDDVDDYMDFCEVGFVIEYAEGEDWCIVDEI